MMALTIHIYPARAISNLALLRRQWARGIFLMGGQENDCKFLQVEAPEGVILMILMTNSHQRLTLPG